MTQGSVRESVVNSLTALNDSLSEWVLFKSVSHEQLQWCFTSLFHWLVIKNRFIRVIHSPVWQHSLYCVRWTFQNRPNLKVTQGTVSESIVNSLTAPNDSLTVRVWFKPISWAISMELNKSFWLIIKKRIARVIQSPIGQHSWWCIWCCLQKTQAFIVATYRSYLTNPYMNRLKVFLMV